MCYNGDCLVLAVLDYKQLHSIINMEILEVLEYTQFNIEVLRERIYAIVDNYNRYCRIMYD